MEFDIYDTQFKNNMSVWEVYSILDLLWSHQILPSKTLWQYSSPGGHPSKLKAGIEFKHVIFHPWEANDMTNNFKSFKENYNEWWVHFRFILYKGMLIQGKER